VACHLLGQLLCLVPLLLKQRWVATEVDDGVGFEADATPDLSTLLHDSVFSPHLDAPEILPDAFDALVAAMFQQDLHQGQGLLDAPPEFVTLLLQHLVTVIDDDIAIILVKRCQGDAVEHAVRHSPVLNTGCLLQLGLQS